MGFLRIGCVALVLACLPHVARAASHRVALLEAADNQVARGEVVGLRADIEDAVRSLGAEVVSFADTKTAAQGDCLEPACMKALQRATSATHVLRVEMAFRRGAFTVQMQLWDATTGQALSSDGKACDVCTMADLHVAVRERAGILCTRVFQAEAQAPAIAPTQAPEPAPKAAEPAAPSASKPAEEPPPAPGKSAGERTGQVAGLALAVLGVAAAAYGGYLLHQNGQSVCRGGEDYCTYRHVTGGRGAGWLIGGMGALFAGSILFYTYTW